MTAREPFWMRLRRIGNRILRRSRISLGNWSFTPKSVPFSSLPRLFTCSFCLKYPNLATIGRGLGAPGFFAPIRWTLSKQMFSTVSSGSFRYVLIKFLTVASGSSSADSGMPENTGYLSCYGPGDRWQSLLFFYFLHLDGSYFQLEIWPSPVVMRFQQRVFPPAAGWIPVILSGI